jgi:hypothetical protein
VKPTAPVDAWKQVGACVLNDGSAIAAPNTLANTSKTNKLCKAACVANVLCQAYSFDDVPKSCQLFTKNLDADIFKGDGAAATAAAAPNCYVKPPNPDPFLQVGSCIFYDGAAPAAAEIKYDTDSTTASACGAKCATLAAKCQAFMFDESTKKCNIYETSKPLKGNGLVDEGICNILP